ncbi:hypothetical protein [Pseudalkalibacillus sp. SCS-8]|uniref:hypothetical protein n=1 Tax=Pseudalkalibacillus nanhaiensis TaxID=3115291 RepID=UPI0032DA044F
MGFSVGMLLLAVLFVTVELPPLIREKQFYPSVIYFILLTIGSILLVLHGLDVKIPNPLDLVSYLFEPISTSILNLFK